MGADQFHPNRPSRYIKELDGLRAIAIALVLAFHSHPNRLRGGYVGVDVFFVISGYLITFIIVKALADHNFRMGRFLMRRIVRLLPAMLMVSAAVLTIGMFYLLPNTYSNVAHENIFAVTFTANIFYLLHTGYFDIAADKRFFLHFWSLAVEMQLYALWAILACLGKKAFPRAITAAGVLSFVYCALWTPHHSVATFYLPFGRVWEFSLGAAVFYAEQHSYRLNITRYSSIISFFGILFLCLAAYGYNARSPYPGWRAAIPALSAAMVMYGANFNRYTKLALSHPAMSYIGRISYGLYLWHWPILVFIGVLDIDGNSSFARLIGLATSAIIAAGVYPVETLLRKKLNAVAERIWMPAVSTVALIGLSLFIVFGKGLPERFYSAAQPALLKTLREKVASARSGLTSFPLKRCVIDRTARATTRPKACTEVPDRGKTIIVWGDSHAAHIMPGLTAQFEDYAIIPLAQFGCPPICQMVRQDCAVLSDKQ